MVDTKTTLKISDVNFASIIKEGAALIDFWADWCGPCRIQGPIMERVADKIGDKVKICKMNVDDNPRTAAKYEVTNIPTLLMFKNGELVQRFVGLQSDSALLNAVNKIL
jgi:thioredoxin 1